MSEISLGLFEYAELPIQIESGDQLTLSAKYPGLPTFKTSYRGAKLIYAFACLLSVFMPLSVRLTLKHIDTNNESYFSTFDVDHFMLL